MSMHPLPTIATGTEPGAIATHLSSLGEVTVHRHAFAALSASALVCLLSVHIDENSARIAVKPAAAAESIECLRFEKTQLDKSIDLRAQSSCDDPLDCSLAYNIICQDRRGKVTSQSERLLHFSVAAGKSETLSLSAGQCSSGWTIDNVRWNCHTTRAR
jgi:hypothetical protein